MGWERGRYYTRSRREAGRVLREYVGGGLRGELAAAQDAEEREEREAQARKWQAERKRFEAADRPLAELDEGLELLLDEWLTLAGYHKHKGQWRRRREQEASD